MTVQKNFICIYPVIRQICSQASIPERHWQQIGSEVRTRVLTVALPSWQNMGSDPAVRLEVDCIVVHTAEDSAPVEERRGYFHVVIQSDLPNTASERENQQGAERL